MLTFLRQQIINQKFTRQSVFAYNLVVKMSTKVDEDLDQALGSNPYYAKYAEKLKKLDPSQVQEKLKEIDSSKKKFNQTIVEQTKDNQIKPTNRTYDELFKPKPANAKSILGGERKEVKLSDIMKIEVIDETIKSKEELEGVWMAYHRDEAKTKNTGEAENYLISGVIGAEKFSILTANSKKHPVFLLPLPREQGYEFFLTQFHLNEVHVTSLLSYQVHKENAPECLKLIHFTEYSDKFKTVLMRGEFNKKVINELEVNCLINQLQLFYCADPESPKAKLLEKFTKNSAQFDHMEIIKEIESLQM